MVPETVLGHYRILRLLGQGGMGEVYAAEDTRLHRTVALKMLPAALAADPDRRKRFEREAQAVAAFNHPNIVTIYSVEEADDVMFLTMEAVDGRTLKEMMDAGALPIDVVLRVAVGMSDALAAAHQRGITHRDLKPANIMVTPDGRVKVLDFGLAKLREAEREAAAEQPTRMQSDHLTGEGRIIGTVAYMSPEQAEGKPVDQRSDIFSAGVVLHEMAAGERPFKGDTDISLISSILKDMPRSITDLRPDLPAGLARIVRRCLAKDPERRYQSGTDLRNDLEELKQDLDSGTAARPAPVVASRKPKRAIWWLAVGLVAVVAIAAGLFAWLRFGRGPAPPAATFITDHFTRLTDSGHASTAALSRDGRYVVHVKAENGLPSVWVRQTATTSDVPIVTPGDVGILGLTFSPDGNYVYYNAVPRGSAVGSLYKVPVLGGTPIPVLENVDSVPSFSPDGRNMTFVRGLRGDPATIVNHLMVAAVDGSGARTLAVGKQFMQATPAWSPDGKTILVPASQGAMKGMVSAVDAVTGAIHVVSDLWLYVRNVQWMPDGRSFVLEGSDSIGVSGQLWQVVYPSAERRRITNDLSNYAGVSLSADGALLATVQSSRQAKIWIVPPAGGEGREIDEGRSGRATGANGISWTPDGRIVFTANAGSVMQLWSVGADGADLRQLTTGEGVSVMPAVSGDGRCVYYIRITSDGTAIWRMGIDGSDQKQLTKGIDAMRPVPSPDGRFVYFTTASSEGSLTTMRIPADGGEPSQVSDAMFRTTDISTDGRMLMGVSLSEANRRWECALLPAEGGPPRLLGDVAVAAGGLVSSCGFDSAGTSIWYRASRDGVANMFAQPLSGGAERPLTRFRRDASPQIFVAAMSRDGRMAVSRGNVTTDVVLIAAKQVAR
jgi:Tol biopolymer transport system component/predicted Ser/Thr protein kinase